MLSEKIY